jgi:hypothetical protein
VTIYSRNFINILRCIKIFVTFGKVLAKFIAYWLDKALITDVVVSGNILKSYELFGKTYESEILSNVHEVNMQISEKNDLMAIPGFERLYEENYWNTVK